MDRTILEAAGLSLLPVLPPALFSAGVEVHAVDFEWRENARLAPHVSSILSDVGNQRAAEFLAGRFCADVALRRFSSQHAIPIGIGNDRAPIWPPSIVGTISHSARRGRGLAMAAVAKHSWRRSLGVDIERVSTPLAAARLARQVFAPGEGCSASDLALHENTILTLVFSAKESLYKAIAPLVGRYFWFRAVRLVATTDRCLTFRIVEELGSGFEVGVCVEVRYHVQDGWVYTAVEIEA